MHGNMGCHLHSYRCGVSLNPLHTYFLCFSKGITEKYYLFHSSDSPKVNHPISKQLRRCPPYSLLPRLRRSSLLPRSALPPQQMVQTERTRTPHCPSLLRQHHLERVWVVDRFWDFGWNAGEVGKSSMEVVVLHRGIADDLRRSYGYIHFTGFPEYDFNFR